MQKITSKILWVHESGNDNALLSLITYSFYQRMGCEGASMQAYMQFAVAHVGVCEKCTLKCLWDVYERANLFWGAQRDRTFARFLQQNGQNLLFCNFFLTF